MNIREIDATEAFDRLRKNLPVVGRMNAPGEGPWERLRVRGIGFLECEVNGAWDDVTAPLAWTFGVEETPPVVKPVVFEVPASSDSFMWKRGGLEGRYTFHGVPKANYDEFWEAGAEWLEWLGRRDPADPSTRLAAALKDYRGEGE